MPDILPFLNHEDIKRLISALAKRISTDYRDQDLVVIGILKGAFIFLSDLVRQLSIPVEIDFIGASSYGQNTHSSEKIRITKEIDIDILNKNVLIVEDIVDTGLTMVFLVEHLKSFSPKTVKICALLDKKERRKTDIHIDYVGQRVAGGFLVGYGLDYGEKYRNLPGIYRLKLSSSEEKL
ncbi:MAG: hypoxanthine phosphoribosyltransferase [Deltaproteobacteria bacterium]|nr:hypoxanthine phosphoribosyltransferase [Deltaproteobacteria bacterium]MBW1962979.1 hypoxanthine phosphoribosyltransferase [Deltaproteobacteria bacterium]MBW2152450.1 hypoxanthine phosphoribosyltransferase [Deltaproteobacteria bacterium]